MTKRVLDIGNCVPDHAAIRNMIESRFDATVAAARDGEDAEKQLAETAFDLVLINRKLDCDGSDGLPILQRIKNNAATSHVPVMLITNYAEHQQAAVAAGGVEGFGKAALGDEKTFSVLARYLDPK